MKYFRADLNMFVAAIKYKKKGEVGDKQKYGIQHKLIIYTESGMWTVPLIIDRRTGELCVKYSEKTNAFKFIKILLREKKNFRKLTAMRWFKILKKREDRLSNLNYFQSLIAYLWNL